MCSIPLSQKSSEINEILIYLFLPLLLQGSWRVNIKKNMDIDYFITSCLLVIFILLSVSIL